MGEHQQGSTDVVDRVDDIEIVVDETSWSDVSWERPALINEAGRWPVSRWRWLAPLAALALIGIAFVSAHRR